MPEFARLGPGVRYRDTCGRGGEYYEPGGPTHVSTAGHIAP